jgi:trehalose synthase-fused probable maltokinase
MNATTMECLTDWMRRQRWYGGKGRVPVLRRLGAWELPSDEEGVIIRTLLVLDESGTEPLLYQVPTTIRPTIPRGWGHNFIGKVSDDEFVFDGPHDPAFGRALLRMIASGGSAIDAGATAVGTATGFTTPVDGAEISSKVLSGEQSNTSLVLQVGSGASGQRIICKIFRMLHHGENPDVVLQTAISAAGSPHVPASVGFVTGEWDDSGQPSGRARGHLAFAQEFMPGVEDAWRVALRSASAGEDFTERAFALGETTAAVHETLAAALPTREPSLGDIVKMASLWHQRLAVALAEVPELKGHRDAIEAVYDAAQHDAAWPRLQRIHGDYHLGQVLSVPDRGWVLLDFEGEPLRPMYERDQPDVPLRDVAGMLRSFDYVAGSVAMSGSPETAGRATEWARAAREAFLDGYVARSGEDVRAHRLLLDAFEIDKAVYEAVYEKRNRPDWLPIPVTAIARLAARGLAETAS